MKIDGLSFFVWACFLLSVVMLQVQLDSQRSQLTLLAEENTRQHQAILELVKNQTKLIEFDLMMFNYCFGLQPVPVREFGREKI